MTNIQRNYNVDIRGLDILLPQAHNYLVRRQRHLHLPRHDLIDCLQPSLHPD